MIDIQKQTVKFAQEPVDEKQEKELANPENISGRSSFEREPDSQLPLERGRRSGDAL